MSGLANSAAVALVDGHGGASFNGVCWRDGNHSEDKVCPTTCLRYAPPFPVAVARHDRNSGVLTVTAVLAAGGVRLLVPGASGPASWW